MSISSARTSSETVVLRCDNGAEFNFSGRVYSESSRYDEETGEITRVRLYMSDEGKQYYSIISGKGTQKSRRCYEVARDDEMCSMNDGLVTVALPAEMLFAAVFGLCGIDPARAEELTPSLEESLRRAAG